MAKRTPKEIKIRLARATAAAIGSLIFLLLLITNVHADPPTWYVDPGGTDISGCGTVVTPCLTIGYAISEAVDGAAVVLMPGTYTQTAALSINKAITLTSQSSVSKAVVAGNGSIGQVILIESDSVALSGLEVRNGTGDVIRQSDAYTSTVVTGIFVHDCGDECV
jgi:hypothetical protein